MPTIGIPSPWAMPLAVAIPIRSPVNVPGPVPTTIPVSAVGGILAKSSIPSIPRSSLSP